MIVHIMLLAIILNFVLFSESVWMTYEEFFSNYRMDLANLIEIPGQPCPGSMKRINNFGECRKTY